MVILLLLINIFCMLFILYSKNKKSLKTSIGKNILFGFGIFCTVGSILLIDIEDCSLFYSVLSIILYSIYIVKSNIIKSNSETTKITNTNSKSEEYYNNSDNFYSIPRNPITHHIKNFNTYNLSDRQLDAYNRKGDEQINRINNICYNLETKEDYEKAIEVYENIIFNEGMHFTGDSHLMRLAELYYKTEQYDKAWNYLNELQYSYPLLIHKIRCFQVKILKKENRNVDALATLMCANLYNYGNQKSGSIDIERFKKESSMLLKKLELDKDESYFSYLVYLINCQLKNKASLSSKEATLRRNFQTFLHDINSNKNMMIELNKGKKEVKNMNKKAEQDKKQLNIKPGYYPKKIQNILNEQPPNTSNINKLNEFYQNRSKKLYEIHLANINNFVIESNMYNTSPITSVEKSFLKYIDSQPIVNPSIAQYWTYEYNLDFNKTINRFLDNGYIKIVNYKRPNNMTVPELKEILKKANIKASGNKDNLIKLAQENIKIETLEKLFDNQNKYFLLTDKGIELTSDIQPSITKDLEFENKCCQLIMDNKISEAYKLICEFECKKNIPRGLGIDWNNELKEGISQTALNSYKKYMDTDFKKQLPDKFIQYEEKLKAGMIFCQMMGVGFDKRKLMIERIIDDINKDEVKNIFNIINI